MSYKHLKHIFTVLFKIFINLYFLFYMHTDFACFDAYTTHMPHASEGQK